MRGLSSFIGTIRDADGSSTGQPLVSEQVRPEDPPLHVLESTSLSRAGRYEVWP